MMPRWFVPCLIFMLLAVGGAWSFRSAKTERNSSTAVAQRIGSGVREIQVRPTAQFLATESLKQGAPGNDSGLKPVASIGVGAAALLTEEIELRAMGGDLKVALTEREWAALAGVTLNIQAVRHAYEAEIAMATMTADGRARLEIPEYVEAGATLRTEFYSTLLKELGQAAATEVIRKLSDRLEARFAGFGAAVQTLEVSSEESAGAGTKTTSVTRTVVFWNAHDASDASRMRRETVFPQMEDPDGQQWGPLLARIEMAQKKARG